MTTQHICHIPGETRDCPACKGPTKPMDILLKQNTLTLPVGTKVYCTVHGCEGWRTFLAVRPRDGYIKVSGVNTWNPPHNFSLTDRQGRTLNDRL